MALSKVRVAVISVSIAAVVLLTVPVLVLRDRDPGRPPGHSRELAEILRYLEPFDAPGYAVSVKDLRTAVISGVRICEGRTAFIARPEPDGTYSLRLETRQEERGGVAYRMITSRVERSHAELVRDRLERALLAKFPPYQPVSVIGAGHILFFVDLPDGRRLEFGGRDAFDIASTPLGSVVNGLAKTFFWRPLQEAEGIAEVGAEEWKDLFTPKTDRPYMAAYDITTVCTADDASYLADEIQQTIEPESWDAFATSIEERDRLLVVVTSRAIHGRIAEFLESRGLTETDLNPIPAEHFLSLRSEKVVEPTGKLFPGQLEILRPADLTSGTVQTLPGARVYVSITCGSTINATAAEAVRATGLPLLAATAVDSMLQSARASGRDGDSEMLDRLARRWRHHSPWASAVIRSSH